MRAGDSPAQSRLIEVVNSAHRPIATAEAGCYDIVRKRIHEGFKGWIPQPSSWGPPSMASPSSASPTERPPRSAGGMDYYDWNEALARYFFHPAGADQP